MLNRVLGINKIEVDKDHLFNVRKNLEYNKPIIKYYKRLLFNTRFVNNLWFRNNHEFVNRDNIMWNLPYIPVTTIENTIANLSNCNSLYLLNVYDTAKIKDFVKTNLCKDRFCANCKKVKQASRMARFIPEIKKASEEYHLYHLTLTVPNCDGESLRKTINKMTKGFAKLTQYLKGKEKIRGLDFSKYGYAGAIRSLEVTYKGDSYHPHFHCLLALDYKDGDKNNTNEFSKRFGKVVRRFSDFEVLIQKIWYLLVNQETVTLSNINNIESIRKKRKERIISDLGYSCSMDEFAEDDYHELFKYMTKVGNEDGEPFSFKNFVTLYFELKSVRQIQGYGIFFRIKDEDMEEVIDEKYNLVIDTLNSLEEPRVSTEKVEELYLDDDYILISRKKIYSYLRELEKREQEEILKKEELAK